MSALESVGLSHIGVTREENQDAIRLSRQALEQSAQRGELFAVADGMGGYAHGGVASTLALEQLFAVFFSESAAPASALRRGMEAANLAIYQHAQRSGAGRMGTTLTAVHIQGWRLHLAHIGDSRAYLIRDGRATCLTTDHTRVGELVRMRVLPPDKLRTHTQRSILTKCLGLELFVQPDVHELALREDDRLVLCSDGVWSVIQDDEFAGCARAAIGVEAYSRRLIDLALERCSDDNVSVVVIHVHSFAPAASHALPHGGWPGLLTRLKRAYGRSSKL